MNDNIQEMKLKLLWKEVDEIKENPESKNNPRDSLLKIHERFKKIISLSSFEKGRTFFDDQLIDFDYISIYYSRFLRRIQDPDNQVVNVIKELGGLEQTSVGNVKHSSRMMSNFIDKHPEFNSDAVDFFKTHYNEANSHNLMLIAEKHPEFKADVLKFLAPRIVYDAENYGQMVSFACFADDEQTTTRVINTLRNSEFTKHNFKAAMSLANLSNNEGDFKIVINALHESQLPEHDPVASCKYILESHIAPLESESIKKELSKEVFFKAEDAALASYPDSTEYCHLHTIINHCFDFGADIMPAAIYALKRETSSLAQHRMVGGNRDLQSETFVTVLDKMVNKNPELAEEALGMIKAYNRALGKDEKFTSYDDQRYYYHALGTFAKADERLKPEVMEIIKANLAKDKADNFPYGHEYYGYGKKIMQELQGVPLTNNNTKTY